MKVFTKLMLLLAILSSSGMSGAQGRDADCSLQGHPLNALMHQDFSASQSVGHTGHSFWWDYRASLKSGSYTAFGSAPTFMVAVRTPDEDKQFYLNLCSGDIVRVSADLHAEPTSSTVLLPKGSDGYREALSAMKEMLTRMISMDSRNASLAAVVQYLDTMGISLF